MTGKRRLTKSLNSLDSLKQNIAREFPGILGAQFKGQTLVEVPNRDGYVYVRLRSNTNEVLQAYNSMVSPVYGLPVTVIRDSTSNRYIIKGRDLGQYENWGSSAYLPRHGAQHSFPDTNWGGDIVWVYDRQYVPLSVSPASGTSNPGSIFVYPDTIYWGGSWLYVGATTSPDLLSYKPTNNQAKLVLVYLDTYGVVQYEAGSLFDASDYYISDLIPHIPALPAGASIPLAAVRLVSGTSSISWNEIYDLRPMIGGDINLVTGSSIIGHIVQDEGTPLTQRANLNFKGTTVWAIDNPGSDATDIIISGSTAAAGGHTIQNEGTPLTQRTNLNFKGSTVWAVDNPGDNATDIIISGSAGVPNSSPILDGSWSISNKTEDKVMDCDATSLDEVADVLGTLVDTLKVTGGGATGTSSGHIIQDEGVSRTARSKLNFVGVQVTVTDDSANDATKVNITTSGSFSGTENYYAKFTAAGGWIENGLLHDNGLGTETDYPLTATDVTATDDLIAQDDLRVSGKGNIGEGLVVGNMTGTAAAGEAIAETFTMTGVGTFTLAGDIRAGGGLSLGNTGVDPDVGDVDYTGNLHPAHSGTTYTGLAYVPLTTPLINSVHTGTVSVNTYTIDVGSQFSGAPNGGFLKAVVIHVSCKWAAASESSKVAFADDVSATTDEQLDTLRADTTYLQQAQVIVPCDANGNFGMFVFNANALAMTMKLCGYFV